MEEEKLEEEKFSLFPEDITLEEARFEKFYFNPFSPKNYLLFRKSLEGCPEFSEKSQEDLIIFNYSVCF